MAEPDVARFEALLTSRGRELLDRIATEAPGVGERALICSGASDFTQIIDHPISAEVVTRLGVGSGRQFSETTQEALVADLRSIVTPQCVTRAREVATRMTKPAESVASAADLLEDAARRGRFG